MKKSINYESDRLKSFKTSDMINLSKNKVFVARYIDDLTNILSLPLGTKQLLVFLALLMDEEGVIILNKGAKNQIATQLKISIGTIDNYISILVQAGIFKRIGRGKILANPRLFPQPKWNRIVKEDDIQQSGTNEKYYINITYLSSGERQISFSIE